MIKSIIQYLENRRKFLFDCKETERRRNTFEYVGYQIFHFTDENKEQVRHFGLYLKQSIDQSVRTFEIVNIAEHKKSDSWTYHRGARSVIADWQINAIIPEWFSSVKGQLTHQQKYHKAALKQTNVPYLKLIDTEDSTK